jgi:hypothetical protein
MAPFARDMALALNPPAGVPFHAASASQQAEAGGRVGAEGHSGRGAAGAMSGGLAGISGSATVEGQEVPEEVHAAVITAAKELLHFLAVHRMLGCFRVSLTAYKASCLVSAIAITFCSTAACVVLWVVQLFKELGPMSTYACFLFVSARRCIVPLMMQPTSLSPCRRSRTP